MSCSGPTSGLWRLRILLIFSLFWVAPALACGSFAPRPTPTPTLLAQTGGPIDPQIESGSDAATATPVALVPTPLPITAPPTPTAGPTATLAPPPVAGTVLQPG